MFAKPPSTPKICPVIQLWLCSKSQAMACAMSLGSPMRPNACIATELFKDNSFDMIFFVSGVRTKPGATALNRILWRAYVADADRTNPLIPALDAAIESYKAMCGVVSVL